MIVLFESRETIFHAIQIHRVHFDVLWWSATSEKRKIGHVNTESFITIATLPPRPEQLWAESDIATS
jgi:hypothetical protein